MLTVERIFLGHTCRKTAQYQIFLDFQNSNKIVKYKYYSYVESDTQKCKYLIVNSEKGHLMFIVHLTIL